MGGVEIPLSFLFADVRSSTGLGERLGPKGLHELMGRFYTSGVEALIAHGAIVERFMGDQVVGYFPAERRVLSLKGITVPVAVRVLRVDSR